MVVAGGVPSAEDLDRLAHLHRRTLPTSVLGRMGTATLRRYYRWLGESPLEWLFTSRGAGGVDGAAVISFSPASLVGRFVKYSPLAFLTTVMIRFAADAAFRRELVAYVREARAAEETKGPELLQVFVAPDRQGQAVGSALLTRVAEALGERRVTAYWVRTLQDGNERTLAFYRGRGFEYDRAFTFCGARYVLLKKVLEEGTQ
jgi:GNAT superfamily N-acetyltransferase